jgi:hypothetical protein
MKRISRRQFLASAAYTVAATQLLAQLRGDGKATITLPAEATGAQMPADFVGLSYEVQQLVDPIFFSTINTGLIRAFRSLSLNGVLRLGGNTSEFAYWRPTKKSPEPRHPKTRVVEGEPKPIYYPVTEKAVSNLAEFLKATGWSCLYGIGMGTNTPERAAAEAEYVAKTLGSSLHYFQIGNEVDMFDRHLRDPNTWNAKAYLDEWLTLARAIKDRVPDAVFGIPDVAADVSWLPQIAELWPSIQNPPRVSTLTHHYYFGGPATNPDVNIPNLLRPATMAKVQNTANIATAAASKVGARVRMTEGNTCYRGGKPGVSDVFASALWAADYSLMLASNNYSGINLHGGTGKSVANSVGGVLPGDTMLQQQGQTPEQIATHPHPFYTPIGTFGWEYVLEPVAYGLRFAGSLSGGTFLLADFTTPLEGSGVNATGYAVKMPSGDISIILLNKDLERDLEATLNFGSGKSGIVEVETLHAPSITSRDAQITSSGSAGNLRDGIYQITVRKASGVHLTVKA